MQSICPVCAKAGLEITTNTHNIPYFEEVMETLVKCDSCGYRHVDVLVLGEKEPSRYTLKIESAEDMHARVVRSGRSTVEVVELGVKITPGPDAQGYISNVEGVLKRIEDIVMMQGESKKKEEILQKIKDAKEGKFTLNLIITDPSGNSAIISDKAKKEEI
jgi:zinc finger protein